MDFPQHGTTVGEYDKGTLPRYWALATYDVIIVGAGAAGIGAGLELAERGVSFVLLEAATRVGGRAYTDRSSLSTPWDQGCHWLHSANVNPLVSWADRLGAVYEKEERVDHFSIWRDGRFASADELIEARRSTLAAFAAIDDAAEKAEDVSIQDVLPDAGRWKAGVRCVMQMMAGADPELVSAPGYLHYEDTDVNWPVLSGYGDLIARMASTLPVRLGVPVEEIIQRPGSVELRTPAGPLVAKAAIVTVSTNVLASGAIRFSGGPAAEFPEIVADLPCGVYEKVALAVDALPPETAGKIFCMIDPGTGEPAMDFQITSTSPPVLIAHLAGDVGGAAIDEGAEAMIALARERLVLAFGGSFRKKVVAAGASAWTRNPLVRGSYAHARPGAAHRRMQAISAETGNVAFAGEALSPRWSGAAHGAYQSGRDKARRIAKLVRSAKT